MKKKTFQFEIAFTVVCVVAGVLFSIGAEMSDSNRNVEAARYNLEFARAMEEIERSVQKPPEARITSVQTKSAFESDAAKGRRLAVATIVIGFENAWVRSMLLINQVRYELESRYQLGVCRLLLIDSLARAGE